jgi:hypothetical protein
MSDLESRELIKSLVIEKYPDAELVIPKYDYYIIKRSQVVFKIPAAQVDQSTTTTTNTTTHSNSPRYIKMFTPTKEWAYNTEIAVYRALSESNPDFLGHQPISFTNIKQDGSEEVFKGLLIENAGTPLNQISEKGIVWSFMDYLTFLKSAFMALKELHRSRFHHTDIRGSNVCFNGDLSKPTIGCIKLIDFDRSQRHSTRQYQGLDIIALGTVLYDFLIRPDTSVITPKESDRALIQSVIFPFISVLESESLLYSDVDEIMPIIDRRLKWGLSKHSPYPSPSNRAAETTTTTTTTKKLTKTLLGISFIELKRTIDSDPDSYLDCWDTNTRMSSLFPHLGYTRAMYVIQNGTPPSEFDTSTKLENYYNHMEFKYREMFASDRNNQILEDDPYLLLDNLYGSAGGGRNDILKQDLSEEERNMFFLFKDALNKVETGTRLLVSSLEEFHRNWKSLTHNLFEHVDFDNVFIAGGSVLAALQPDFEDGGLEDSMYAKTDIDVFLYGLELDQVEEKVIEIYEAIMKRVTGNMDFVAEMAMSPDFEQTPEKGDFYSM